MAITYGCMSSRFWLLRKHVNSIQRKTQLEKLPFQAWNCITLHLPHREVDLVLPSEQDMIILIKFLVYRLETIDGQRGTAIPILKHLNSKKINEFLEQTGRGVISRSREHQIMSSNEYMVYKKVCLKYTIMRVRSKISYTALYNRQTVCELFMNTIRQCFSMLTWQKWLIPQSDEKEKRDQDLYNAVIRGEPDCLKKLIKHNSHNIKNDTLHENIKKLEDEEKLEPEAKKNVEKIYVKKHGRFERLRIDHDKNRAKQLEICDILKKDNCLDIFRDAFLEAPSDDQNRLAKFTAYKFKRKSRVYIYNKLRLLLNLGILGGILYIRVNLKRI